MNDIEKALAIIAEHEADKHEKKKIQLEYTRDWQRRNKKKILEDTAAYRRNNKRKAVQYLGGKCSKCNGEFHPAVYDFHHKDPSQKEGALNGMMNLGWERILEEIIKCELLCANCHRLQHAMENGYE